MNKKNVFTAVGIILSFVIAVGGWVLTRNFIETKSDKLLSATLNISTNTLDNTSVDMIPTVPNNKGDDFSLTQSNLPENEISAILKNWDSSGHETPHEPTEEQLNMEKAIEAGKEWLSFINELSIFPDELLRFSNVRAYLFQNISSEQNRNFLPPAYSYWKIAFSNESININVLINAVTGQVWKTDIDIFKVEISINDYDITNALAAFVSYLEINNDEVGGIKTSELTIMPVQNENTNEIVGEKDNVKIIVATTKDLKSLTASHSFIDENIKADVMTIGWKLEDGKWNINTFKMHLVSNK